MSRIKEEEEKDAAKKKKGEDEEGRRERRVDGIPVPSYRICKGAHTQ